MKTATADPPQKTHAAADPLQKRRELREGRPLIDISVAKHPVGAAGCGSCRFGLVGEVRTNGPAPLYLLRVYQAERHLITFCTCAAGAAYRSYLLRRYRLIRNGEDVVPQAMDKAIRAWLGGEYTWGDYEMEEEHD